MRILTLVPGGIDEQILFFPTLTTLKQAYPQALIDVIVSPAAKPAYRVCPDVNEVLVFDYAARNGLADYLNLLGIIRDREYDISLNLSSSWTMGFLQWLNGIPIRVGFENEASRFITHAVPFKNEQYRPAAYHDLLQGLGIHAPCPPLKLTLPREDIDWAEATQRRLDIKDSGYILLYGEANEANPSTYYPLDKWRTLIDNFQEKQPNLPLVLLQLAEDRPWIRQIKEAYPSLKIVQPMDIGKLAAIIAGANLLVCPPSTPLTLAIALGTYTVALLPVNQRHQLFPAASEAYGVIESKSDKIADIAPETVLEKIWRG